MQPAEVQEVLRGHELALRDFEHTNLVAHLCACNKGTYGLRNGAEPPHNSAVGADGGTCFACGAMTVRTGSCTTCTSCGTSSGCG